MDSYNHLFEDMETEVKQPANLTEIHAEFHTQFKNLEYTIKPYNDNIANMWNKIAKFEPNTERITFRNIDSLADGLFFYSNLTTSSMFAELSVTQWTPPQISKR